MAIDWVLFRAEYFDKLYDRQPEVIRLTVWAVCPRIIKLTRELQINKQLIHDKQNFEFL